MDSETFDTFKALVAARSGIRLGENKMELIEARVGRRMRELGISDIRDYLAHVTGDESGAEFVHLIDAISTNVTRFFREPDDFDFIDDCFRRWMKKGQTTFRFWSAACATGEEPYSLAIKLIDTGLTSGVDVKILATDISTRALERCQAASYDDRALVGVDASLKRRYFDRIDFEGSTRYAVKARVKDLVVPKRLNLSSTPFPIRGPLDVILCRNVMMYFDVDLRRRLIAEAHRLLKPGGYLIVGTSESLVTLDAPLVAVRPSIYQKEPPGGGR